MKKFYLFFLFLLFSMPLCAQVTITNKEVNVTVKPGTDIYINGHYEDAGSGNISYEGITNDGNIHITGNLTNGGAKSFFNAENSTGRFFLTGADDQTVAAEEDTVAFPNLTINKPSGSTVFDTQVSIAQDSLEIIKGDIQLNDLLVLERNTVIAGESLATGRIFGGGAIETTRILDNTIDLNAPLGGLGLNLLVSGQSNLGPTKLIRTHMEWPVTSGSILRSFALEPFASGSIDNLNFRYLGGEELNGIAETDLELWSSPDAGSSWYKQEGTLDEANHLVEASDVEIGENNIVLTLASADCDDVPISPLNDQELVLCTGNEIDVDVGIEARDYNWLDASDVSVGTSKMVQLSEPGDYTLEITSNNGCVGVSAFTILEKPLPEADFNFPAAGKCLGEEMAFTNASSIESGEITLYNWDFGIEDIDTDVSDKESPAFVFPEAGHYNVTLIVESAFGCADTISKPVTIHPLPEVDFDFSDGCGGEVAFTNLTTHAEEGVSLSYLWDFGDGNNSTEENPSNPYAAFDDFEVTLTVTADNTGCSASVTKVVRSSPGPVADFTFTTQCAGEAVAFTNESSISAGSLSYHWDFGVADDDSDELTEENPSFVFPQSGLYNVNLTVSSDQGCEAEVTKTVLVHAIPEVDFSFSTACAGESVIFTNESPNGDFSYRWSREGVDEQLTRHATYFFDTSGDYVINLEVTNNNTGCTNDLEKIITIAPLPVADFTFSEVCDGEEVAFNNLSTGDGGLTYSWDFGVQGTGTSTSTEEHPSFVFPGPGDYQVLLTVFSAAQCEATIEKTVTISERPEIDLGTNISTCGSSYRLDATVANATSFKWRDEGTGTIIGTSADILIDNNGDYSVTITSNNGCTYTEHVQVTLNSSLVVDLGDDVVACGETILDAGYPGGTYLWSTGETSRTITVTQNGEYSVEVTDPNACSASASVNVSINDIPEFDLGEDITLCEGEVAILNPQLQDNGLSFLWSTGATSPTLEVSSAGMYHLTVSNGENCSFFDDIEVVVTDRPEVSLGDDFEVCDFTAGITLDAGDFEGYNYRWSTGETSRSITVFGPGVYDVTLTNGVCTVQDEVELNSSVPAFDLGEDVALCAGESIILDPGLPETLDFLWSTGATASTLTVTEPGLYQLTVLSQAGCALADEIAVSFAADLPLSLPEEIYICNPETGVALDAGISNVAYQWTLNGSVVSNEQQVVIKQPGSLELNVNDAIGCTATTSVNVLTSDQPISAFFLATTEAFVGDSVFFINESSPQPYDSFWDFGDGATSTVTSPIQRYFISGEYKVLLEIDNGFCQDTITKVINISGEDPGKDGDNNAGRIPLSMTVRVFPVPTSGLFDLEVEVPEETSLSIDLYNMNRLPILHDEGKTNNKEWAQRYDLSGKANGIYIIRVATPQQVIYQRVLKK